MVCLIAVLLAGSAATVSATTGPTRLLQKPKYSVSSQVALLYRGQYVLRSVAKAARIHDAAMGVEINEFHWMYGVAQFYGYDQQGFQSSWVSTLYNFHALPHNRMTVDLLGPTGTPFLGRLYVTRMKNGDLVGQIQLGKHKYAVSFHKINNR